MTLMSLSVLFVASVIYSITRSQKEVVLLKFFCILFREVVVFITWISNTINLSLKPGIANQTTNPKGFINAANSDEEVAD